MNQIPAINTFLEEIDPNKTIDREKAITDITTVTLLWAIKDARGELSEEEQGKLDKILKNKEKFDFEALYELFDNAGKKEKLLSSINDNVNKVRVDYIKTHLDSMPADKRDQVLSKFPILKEL